MRPGWRSLLRAEIGTAERLVILGVGNPGKGDDAAGVLCAEEVKAGLKGRRSRPPVRVVIGGEVPESVTGLVRRFRPSLVLIIDAALSSRPPGSIFAVDKAEMAEDDLTTHRMPLPFLLTFLEETVGCRVRVFGIQPKAVARNTPPSGPVRRAARSLAREILIQVSGSLRPAKERT